MIPPYRKSRSKKQALRRKQEKTRLRNKRRSAGEPMGDPGKHKALEKYTPPPPPKRNPFFDW